MLYLSNLQNMKCNKKELLFFIPYSLLIIYMIAKSMTIGINDHGVTYLLIIFLLLCRILTMRIKVKDILWISCICLFVVLCTYKTWDPIIPIVLLMVFASQGIDFNIIVKISYMLVFPMVIIAVLLAVLGIIEDTTIYRTLYGHYVVCHGAGFYHSSALPTYYYFLFLEYFYLKKGRVNFLKLLFWIAGGIVIFLFCAERLRFYLLIIAGVLACIEKIVDTKFKKLEKYILVCIYPCLCILSLLGGYFYNSSNSIMYSLNVTLSNRLYLENYALKNYGITLFGQVLKMGEDSILVNGNLEYFYIDAGYIYIFVVYGLIVGTMILGAYVLGAYKTSQISNYALFVWFVCVAIDAMVGNRMLSIWINPLLFLPFCSVNNQSKEEF